jgi:hypothetical protein
MPERQFHKSRPRPRALITLGPRHVLWHRSIYGLGSRRDADARPATEPTQFRREAAKLGLSRWRIGGFSLRRRRNPATARCSAEGVSVELISHVHSHSRGKFESEAVRALNAAACGPSRARQGRPCRWPLHPLPGGTKARLDGTCPAPPLSTQKRTGQAESCPLQSSKRDETPPADSSGRKALQNFASRCAGLLLRRRMGAAREGGRPCLYIPALGCTTYRPARE